MVGQGDFNHGYTYSGHPVAAAVALENLRIMQDEHIVEHVRDVAHPYLTERWSALTDHPLVGEAKLVGLMGSIALTPDKARRAAKFASEDGTVGYRCRERCFANNLIMRHVGRPDDHLAAAGDHPGRDRHPDRACPQIAG